MARMRIVRWVTAPPVRAAVKKNTRLFSSSSSSFSSSSSSSSSPPPGDCDIVKGPSLLRTAESRPSPSLLFLPGLRSLPFWTQTASDTSTRVAYNDPSVTFAVEHLEQYWAMILEEYQIVSPLLQSDYQTDTEHSLHDGKWDWHSYMLKGRLQGQFAQHFPKTTSILQVLRDEGLLFEGTPFGYAFFSTLHAKSRISAHTSPMNFRVRVHLPLIVPLEQTTTPTGDVACGIRVGPLTRKWVPGKALVLDDAYNHEVWNDADTARVLLLVDLWHPDVSGQERKDVVKLFQHAQDQGWWSSS